jgi:hypothetical protein
VALTAWKVLRIEDRWSADVRPAPIPADELV